MTGGGDLQNVSMLDLFRTEVEDKAAVVMNGLLALEDDPTAAATLEELMRAAHSIKGAARMVNVPPVVSIAHVMEDGFVAAQKGVLVLGADATDVLLKAIDTISQIAKLDDAELQVWPENHAGEIDTLVAALRGILSGGSPEADSQVRKAPAVQSAEPPTAAEKTSGIATRPKAAPAKNSTPKSAVDVSMLDLFRTEVEDKAAVVMNGLLALEDDPTAAATLEELMRAAHSIKGAARMVDVPSVVSIAHVMEDGFVAAQKGVLVLGADATDVLLRAIDTISQIAKLSNSELQTWPESHAGEIDTLVAALRGILSGEKSTTEVPVRAQTTASTANTGNEPAPGTPAGNATSRVAAPAKTVAAAEQPTASPDKDKETAGKERMLRISAARLDRLMGLAGETLVESRWLTPFANSMNRLKRRQGELIAALDNLRESLSGVSVNDYASSIFKDVEHKANECRSLLSERLTDLEQFDRRTSNIAKNLHHEAIASRMRPFSDGVQGLQRLVRDLARQLGKKAKLEIHGPNTQVDRDVLEKIKAPLDHMLRNALDHGIDTPEERMLLGKPEVGTIRLEAFHNAGMLSIVISDDGRGVDLDRLREKIIAKGLVNAEMAANLSESELLEFLFLPSFSTRDTVTEMSGRGVGMDVVHDTVKEMGGMVRANSTLGKGMRIQMQLPLTLSVLRALLVRIGGESYAFPLARIERILRLSRSSIEVLENQQYFTLEGDHIGLVSGCQVFGKRTPDNKPRELPVIVVADRNGRFGLVVDEFIGERELAVQVLDPRLGKVKDVSAAALLEDGSPTLIADIDDVVRSIDKLVNEAQLKKVDAVEVVNSSRKRILVVDDSITVREVERNLLKACGYEVEVAVDGMDGWNAVRSGSYNLVITDIDMPRMDGISLVSKMKGDEKYKSLPVMIVSYKDREEDRRRGLSAGADYYLTKGSFHDETLREAVVDLIGEAQ